MADSRQLILLHLLTWMSWMGCACAPSTALPSRVSSTPRATTLIPPLLDGSTQRIESKFHNVHFSIPDGKEWTIRDTDQWLQLKHEASSSQLQVRVWVAGPRMTHATCQNIATTRFILPLEIRESYVIERRRMKIPFEFDTVATMGVVPNRQQNSFTGFIYAFGGWSRRCFAWIFTTKSTSENVVGTRLANIVENSLKTVQRENDLDLKIEHIHE